MILKIMLLTFARKRNAMMCGAHILKLNYTHSKAMSSVDGSTG